MCTENVDNSTRLRKLTLEQYLFLLDCDITRGLLNTLSTMERQNAMWAEIGRHEDRMEEYEGKSEYTHYVSF